AAAEEIIRGLWRGTHRNVYYSSLTKGLSGADVYLTESDDGSWPRVVKYGNKKLILNEVRRYQRFIRGRLPGAPLLFGPEQHGHSYGIAYEYAVHRTPPSKKGAPIGATLEEILEGTISHGW